MDLKCSVTHDPMDAYHKICKGSQRRFIKLDFAKNVFTIFARTFGARFPFEYTH